MSPYHSVRTSARYATLTRLSLLLCSALPCFPADPALTHTDVFRAGTEGYSSFRIPAIVTAPDGSLVAFAEGRKQNAGDPGAGDIDLVYKRSTDHGASWSPLAVLDDPGDRWAASNPTPVTDRERKRIWIVFNRWEPGMGTERSQPGTSNNQTWIRYSDDNGKTWSPPRDITRSARDFDTWGAMFVGPGGAIQTRTGRLIVPAASKFDQHFILATFGSFDGALDVLRAYVLFSDDHGETWQRGSLVQAFTNENQLVELSGGAILMDARQGNGDHRWFVTSADGGRAWSRPRPGEMVTPVATALERYDAGHILWTGPSGPGRNRLVIRVSTDEGQTFANERVIYRGLAAYSDLTVLDDRSIGVLWERGVTDGYQYITFTRLLPRFVLESPSR
jgi:sialidase-1